MTFDEKIDKAKENTFKKHPEMSEEAKLSIEFFAQIFKCIGEEKLTKR